MARIREGSITIPYQRTNTLKDGWQVRGLPYKPQIYNDVPYSQFVHGDTEQSRHEKAVGWRKFAEVVRTNIKGAIREAQRAVDEWAKSR
jgi:hypothetical protein